jgi:hypothetical protein
MLHGRRGGRLAAQLASVVLLVAGVFAVTSGAAVAGSFTTVTATPPTFVDPLCTNNVHVQDVGLSHESDVEAGVRLGLRGCGNELPIARRVRPKALARAAPLGPPNRVANCPEVELHRVRVEPTARQAPEHASPGVAHGPQYLLTGVIRRGPSPVRRRRRRPSMVPSPRAESGNSVSAAL